MNAIEFTRGDTFPFKFRIRDIQNNYLSKASLATLFVTCRRNPDRNCSLFFQKTIGDIEQDENNWFHVVIEPEDTETLNYPAEGKCYYMDIEATTTSGYRKTRLYELYLKKETSIHGGDEDGN